MIGNNNNINAYNTHMHNHNVTECLHKEHKVKTGGEMARSGVGTEAEQVLKQAENFSLKDILADGIRGMVTKASNFWNNLGQEPASGQITGQEETASQIMADMTLPHTALQVNTEAAMQAAASALVSAAVRQENDKNEIAAEEESGKRVVNVENAVSGGLKKGEGGVRKFLHKFGETVKNAGRFLKPEKAQQEVSLSENNADFGVGDGNYLLDSYNRSGEYSTLAKDHSLEGKFKANG